MVRDALGFGKAEMIAAAILVELNFHPGFEHGSILSIHTLEGLSICTPG